MTSIATRKPPELAGMKKAGRIVARALDVVKEEARAGMTTGELDAMVEELIRDNGARPAFKGYRGFPASICTSINEEVVHGIPGERRLEDGDILSVDIGSELDGYYGDAAITVPVGEVSRESRRLIDTTRRALDAAIDVIRAGVTLDEIGRAVENEAIGQGFSVVRQYTGHGIGTQMHESPQIPNFPAGNGRTVLPAGATVAIEPMINAGTHRVKQLDDGWTVVTKDGRRSAHFEHTIAVEENGPSIMTVL
ncbi:MAG: type I methionyl aminopeptidase [Planctomycetota bacterium]